MHLCVWSRSISCTDDSRGMNRLLLQWLRIVRVLIGEKEEREKEGESLRERREGTMHLEERGERKEGKDLCVVMVELKPSHVNKRFKSRKDQRFSHSTFCADD